MDIGREQEIVIVEPLEDPFAPAQPPQVEPQPDRELEPVERNRTATSGADR